jgi:hypothetical protein
MIARSFTNTRGLLVALCVSLSVAGVWCAAAVAGEPVAPGYHVFGYVLPSESLPPGGEGALELRVFNDGAGVSSGEGPTLVDTLPAGLTATGGGGCTGEHVVVCHLAALPVEGLGGTGYALGIRVRVAASASGEALDRVVVSGGGALGVSGATVPVRFSSQPAGAGFSNVDAWVSSGDGMIDTQAGSHPYQFTVAFALNAQTSQIGEVLPVGGGPGELFPVGGEERTIDVKLPPGFSGDPAAVPQCPRAVFDGGAETGELCPADTLVGFDTLRIGRAFARVPIHNIVPPPGVVAQFGFGVSGEVALLDVRVRSGGDYGLTVQTNNIPQLGVTFNAATIWGVPGEHNGGGSSRPFLTLPTGCGAPPTVTAEELGTWEDESVRAQDSVEMQNEAGEPSGWTGCERLTSFDPTVSLTPETSFADTPSGLAADVHLPQETNGGEIATSGVHNVTVTLPEGMVINPGQATGLVACQPSQENVGGPEAETEAEDGPPSCPAASKIGTVEVSTPLLPDKLLGNMYVLGQNPPNLQVLVAASGDGVNVKLIANMHLDETTGRLTATFNETPDLPFSDFKLSFEGGQHAAVVTPQACGAYESKGEISPWSDPLENIISDSTFQITAGPGGSPCAPPSFTPAFQAGTTVNQAGAFSPVSVAFSRQDSEQYLGGVQVTTPPGLSAILTGVERCGEPQASQGTCAAGSLIGHTTVTAGPGGSPLVVPGGQVFLTGPYKGAPFGLSIVVPAIAGPFNLGNVVVRAAVDVDPHTAQITIVSDQLPTILDGVPLQIKSANVDIDRQGFTFNPTSCTPMAVNGVVTSTQGTQSGVSSRFQAAGCASLPFHPSFAVSTQARTSKQKGASLLVKVGSGAGQANIAKAAVSLPKQLPSRLTTIQQACPEAVFDANPASCPVGSDVGTGTVRTPILANSLSGPVYLVSHGGAAFPDIVVILQGEGVTLDLVGSIDIKGAVTSSTFATVPDAPVTSFQLALPEGPHSALATDIPGKAKGSLCGQSLVIPTTLTGQNGAVLKQSTKIAVTGCPKAKAKKKIKKAKGKGHKQKHTANGKRGK